MKISPIDVTGHQINITDKMWREFDKTYTEETELTFDRFSWYDLENGRAAQNRVHFLNEKGYKRYMDQEYFFKNIADKMVRGKIIGKFGFYKKQGSPGVNIELLEERVVYGQVP